MAKGSECQLATCHDRKDSLLPLTVQVGVVGLFRLPVLGCCLIIDVSRHADCRASRICLPLTRLDTTALGDIVYALSSACVESFLLFLDFSALNLRLQKGFNLRGTGN